MQAPHPLDRRGARLREAMDLVGTVALLGVVPTLADMATTQSGLPSEPFVFFVHSYFPVPEDESIVTARTTYGESFAAAAAKDNVAGVQFHPEKSQEVGLTILRNFVAQVQGGELS